MASAQEPCTVKLYVEEPTGKRHPVIDRRVEELGPSGSSDHGIALTPSKWVLVPTLGGTIHRGWRLIMVLVADGADTTDKADCVFSIPYTDAKGGQHTITDKDFTLTDVTTVANVPVEFGYYEFKGGPFRFGGGKIFISIEDDT